MENRGEPWRPPHLHDFSTSSAVNSYSGDKKRERVWSSSVAGGDDAAAVSKIYGKVKKRKIYRTHESVLPTGPIHGYQNFSRLDDCFSNLLDGYLVERVPLEKKLVENVLKGDFSLSHSQNSVFFLAAVSLPALGGSVGFLSVLVAKVLQKDFGCDSARRK